MADIFISYASEDREAAARLAGALEDRGWSVFWDRTIPPGHTWDDVIEAELGAARSVVVQWSRTSVSKPWVRVEASEGLKRAIPVPPPTRNVRPDRGQEVQIAPIIRHLPITNAQKRSGNATGLHALPF